jgi:hypothetical protein
MKNTKTFRKKYGKRTRKSRKGGQIFGKIFSKNTTTTQPIMNTADKKRLLDKPFTDIETTINENIAKIDNLKLECMNQCKTIGCNNPDPEVCNQLNDMINTKNTYDWVNLCKNAYGQKECIEYLDTYSLLETYAGQITRLYNEKVSTIKQKLEELKKSIHY